MDHQSFRGGATTGPSETSIANLKGINSVEYQRWTEEPEPCWEPTAEGMATSHHCHASLSPTTGREGAGERALIPFLIVMSPRCLLCAALLDNRAICGRAELSGHPLPTKQFVPTSTFCAQNPVQVLRDLH